MSSSPERAISTPVHAHDGSNTGGAMSVTLDEIAQFFTEVGKSSLVGMASKKK